MKRFSRILFYLRSQKQNIVLYLIFTLFSILFSLVSLAMLAPFLQLLFNKSALINVEPAFALTANGVLNYLKYFISKLITENGEVYALGAICGLIIVSVFFKKR